MASRTSNAMNWMGAVLFLAASLAFFFSWVGFALPVALFTGALLAACVPFGCYVYRDIRQTRYVKFRRVELSDEEGSDHDRPPIKQPTVYHRMPESFE